MKAYAVRLAIGLGLLALVLTALYALWGERLLAPTDHTWQTMQARGTWRIGMDPSFPPFEMLDENGQPSGFDVALAKAIAGEWGLKLEIVSIGFDGLIDALLVGKVDSVVSALPYDPRLTEDVHYSTSYFEAGVRLAVPADSDIQAIDDLAGRTVAVEWGSAGDAAGRKLQERYPQMDLASFPTPEDALNALLAGQSDALLVDGVTLRLAQGQGAPLVVVGPALESNPYVIATPRHAADLNQELDRILAEFRQNGTLEALEAQWFANTSP